MKTAAQRFWEKVDVRGPDECWTWKGSIRTDGYGHVRIGGKNVAAHRASYAFEHGEIPVSETFRSVCVLHGPCDNRLCVNPLPVHGMHLGNHSTNMVECVARGRQNNIRKTHCKHGHEYTPENISPRKDGHRECLTCVRARKARWRETHSTRPHRSEEQ